MFNSIISQSAAEGSIDVKTWIICILVSLALGIVCAISYIIVNKKRESNPHFVVALVILPAVTAVVILLVGSNIARAFSLAGIFALIRFRSQPGDAKDITSVFLCASAGLACGLGYIVFAVIFILIICAAFIVIGLICNCYFKDTLMDLRIVIPEDMNYQNVFDDVLDTYCDRFELVRVKTTNLGSMYELSYIVDPRKKSDQKAMIDEIRCRNGNLTVVMSKHETKKDQL